MKKKLHIWLIFLFSCVPFFAYSTHIVGGSLTYIYNGGSNYTVTLKLYRDCGPGTASFPATVNISVLGYNGATFNPSRDINMSLGTVTPVPANLPPCATAPNPMPCTQEGIYTTTVNNLPPNPGGYHLYYQQIARNGTLSNVVNPLAAGESFYAYIPGSSVYWCEDFNLANGTTVDNGATAWSIAAGTPAPFSASVNGGVFEITANDNAQETWTSQVINIAAYPAGVNLRADLFENGTLEPNDSILVYYRLDGGPLVPFATNGFIANDFANAVATQTGLIGTTIQIIIRVHYDATSPAGLEPYSFDNVLVYGNNFLPNNSSIFNQFPPLFLCRGLPFTFDHSAMDANGDSLVYSFYAPYDGDNGAGALDPTFSNNVAIFTPITWVGGYSPTNPLGGGALNLNSSTGLLSGTPTTLGQFVVGIIVREYRNGVLISQTLRDCQFNVINCPQDLAVTIAPVNPTVCFGGTSTTITANGSGGTTPYSYLWNGVNPAQTINVGAGTYSVMLTDASGCQVFASITVTTYSVLITANAGPNDTVCTQSTPIVAALNGSVAGASGGIWSGGGGTFSPNNTTLTGGFYTPTAAEIAAGFVDLTLTTTGNGTCPASSDVVRFYFMGFTGTLSVTPTPVSCFGGNNGSATASVTGGIPPYSYSWNTSPAQTTATASNLSPGTYSVTVQNGIGCTRTGSVIITQPTPLGISSTVTNVSCFGGNNGVITTSVVGGTPAYTYLWNPGGQTTANVSNLVAGSYTLTIRDFRNCLLTATFTITQPPQLLVTLSGGNVSCFGGGNGTVSSTVTGGTTPYTYNWTPTGGTSPNASGLAAGSYTLTVTDFRGCTRTATVSITQPTALTTTVSSTNETCNYLNNGTATASVSGGTPAYTYLWNPGGQSSSAVSNLASGTYTLTVTDNRGCTTTSLVTITQPLTLTASFISQTNVNCFGGNNGAVTANAAGGTPAYTYLWNPGGQVTASATNLTAGTYTLTVTDNRGCQVQNTVTITQPVLALSVTASSTSVTCGGGTNGTVSSSPVGGTAAYTYNWQPGSYTTQTVSNLVAGIYTITITDSRGCTSVTTTTVTQPPVIVLNVTPVNSSCGTPNGQASVAISSGGIAPFTYSWSIGQTTATATGLGAGTYSVLVTDATGCTAFASASINDATGPSISIISSINVNCYGGATGSAIVNASGGTPPLNLLWTPYGGTGTTATGLIAGTYAATVTDGNGCKASVSIIITQPTSALASAVTAGAANCFGGSSGSASVLASGGTPAYTYTWLPSGNTGSTINGLTANTYTAQVTDANGCVQFTPFVISEPTQLTSFIASSSNVSCYGGNNGTATVNVSGGTPFYTYNWAPSGGNGPTAAGLSVGTYTVNIVDNQGCTRSSSVTITEPSQALTVSGTSSNVNCFGGANGSATANPIGGTPAYTYQWSPSGGTNQIAAGLTTGNYFVVVTDANGCQTNVSYTISQPSSPLSGTLVPVNPSCGFSNGSITSQVSGGTAPYSYLWSTGSMNQNITGVGPNNYTLQITDAASCITTFTATLTNIAGPTAAVTTVNNVSCYGGNNGTATVNITQGTPPYAINWLPYGGNNLSATSLIAGTYTMIVTDGLGCTAPVIATVAQPTPLSVSISSVTPVSCYGGNNGSATVSVSGGTPNYTYSWNNGQTAATATALVAGTYTVNVIDQQNCSSPITMNITQPSFPLVSSISSFSNASCFGGQGSATVLVAGGTIPYSYAWSTTPLQTTSTAMLNAGSYTVTTTDNHGCISTGNVTITQPTPVITTAGPNDTICLVPSLVTLNASATGGTGNYSYQWLSSGIINAGTLNITPASSITYTVIAYDQNGCAGTPDTVSAIVYSLGPGNVQASTLSPICPGQSSFVYVQTTGSLGPFTYAWNNGLPATPGAHIVTPTQPTTYIVTVTNHCGTSVTDSVQILFNPPPIINFSGTPVSSCVPAMIQFTDSSISGNANDSITSWLWSFGDNTTSTLPNPSHIYTQPGTYLIYLTVTTMGGCTSNNAAIPFIFTGYPDPNALFTTNPSVTPMVGTSFANGSTVGSTVNFINQSSGALSYWWDFGDGATSTSTNPQHFYPAVGHYTITLVTTNQYGCTDTFRIETSADGDIVFPNVFTPNPNGSSGGAYNPWSTDNDVFFPFSAPLADYHLEIFNRWGELLFESRDLYIGWDGYYRGQLCQQDVYVWKASVKFMNGRSFKKVGDVTILR